MLPTRTHLTGILTSALIVSFAAACSDSSGPSSGSFTTQTGAVVDSVVGEFFDDNEALNSLDGLGSFISGIAGQPSIAPFNLLAVDNGWRLDLTAGAERDLPAALARVFEANSVSANIPQSWIGATCVWDTTLNQGIGDYRQEPDRTGAPSNGVRFILYTLDAATLRPTSALEEIGFLDIIDLSANPNVDISISADVDGDTLLDYGVTGTYNTSTADYDLAMSGYLGNGTDQLPFDWSASSDATGNDNGMSMDVGPITLSYDYEYDYTGGVETGNISVSNRSSGDDMEIIFASDLATGDLLSSSGIWFNGEQVAHVVGTGENADLELVPGSSFSQQDFVALFEAVLVMGEVFARLDQLFLFALASTASTVG